MKNRRRNYELNYLLGSPIVQGALCRGMTGPPKRNSSAAETKATDCIVLTRWQNEQVKEGEGFEEVKREEVRGRQESEDRDFDFTEFVWNNEIAE